MVPPRCLPASSIRQRTPRLKEIVATRCGVRQAADDHVAAVDAQTRADLEDLVLRVRNEYQVTVVLVTHDIDEAVYVADRVVVMAANPGRVIADVPVDLPRPRDQVATKRHPNFVDLRTRVFELVMRRPATLSAGATAR